MIAHLLTDRDVGSHSFINRLTFEICSSSIDAIMPRMMQLPYGGVDKRSIIEKNYCLLSMFSQGTYRILSYRMCLHQSQNPLETCDVMFVSCGWRRGAFGHCIALYSAPTSNLDWGSGNTVIYRSLYRPAAVYVQPGELGRHRLSLNQSQNP
jgi:hypothetical protein